jgi:hypothetical protein
MVSCCGSEMVCLDGLLPNRAAAASAVTALVELQDSPEYSSSTSNGESGAEAAASGLAAGSIN